MLLKYKIRKILQQNNQKIIMHVLKICLIFFALLIFLIIGTNITKLVLNGSSFIKDEVSSSIKTSKDNLKKIKNSISHVNYTLITEKNIFGNLTTAGDNQQENTTLTQDDIPLALIGTILTKGSTPYAIIEETKNKLQDTFTVGNSVFSIGTLTAILKNKVEIKINGEIKILTIDDFDSDMDEDMGDGPVMYLDATEVKNTLDNLPAVMTQARAIPFWQGGKPVGLRLFAIKSGSIFEKLGLKNGDILKDINGKKLGDFSKAMEIFEDLKNETSLKIQLERSKQETTLQYKIR